MKSRNTYLTADIHIKQLHQEKKIKRSFTEAETTLGNSSKNPSICPKATKNIAFILYA